MEVREKPEASLCKRAWEYPRRVPTELNAVGVKGLKRAVRSGPVVPPTRHGGGAAPRARWDWPWGRAFR